MSRALILFFGIIVAIILAYLCVKKHIQEIPVDVQTRTEAALDAQQLSKINSTIDGRDITLSGIVETAEEKLKAEKIARNVEGVRTVKNKILVATPPAPEPEPVIQEEEIVEAIVAPEITVEEVNKQCEDDLAHLMQGKTIQFASGSAQINIKSIELLKQIGETAKNCPESRIVANGYTDNTGSQATNKRISQARAESVATYLRETAKIPQAIEAIGNGSNNPIASNETKDGRAKNRRIEFNVLPIE